MIRLSIFIPLILLLQSCDSVPNQDIAGKQQENPTLGPLDVDRFFQAEGLFAEGAEWEPLSGHFIYTDAPVADAAGNVYFSEVFANQLYKVNLEGTLEVIDSATGMTKGLQFGPDGLLYGCRNMAAQIFRYSADWEVEVLLQGELSPPPDDPKGSKEFCNDLAINAAGEIWFTDRNNLRVMYLDQDGNARSVAEGFRPNGIALSLDQKILAVTDSNEPVLHAFEILEDGGLREMEGFFDPVNMLVRRNAEKTVVLKPGSDGMTIDSEGRFYLASFFGIQVFDSTGGYLGRLDAPGNFTSNIGFGGPERNWLYATGPGGVYRIETQVQGASF